MNHLQRNVSYYKKDDDIWKSIFQGEVIAEVTDIGFDTVDDVISALANQLPNDIPIGCNVQFRLTNCDSQKEAVYVRSKGKGF